MELLANNLDSPVTLNPFREIITLMRNEDEWVFLLADGNYQSIHHERKRTQSLVGQNDENIITINRQTRKKRQSIRTGAKYVLMVFQQSCERFVDLRVR